MTAYTNEQGQLILPMNVENTGDKGALDVGVFEIAAFVIK
jgi:hypothetical protein